MRKLIGLFVFLTFLGMQICFAQTRQITGKVIDKNDKSPMPGVSVVVKGTSNGTATDVDGKFTLKVEENDVLQVRFMGMKPQEIPVAGKNTITIELEPVLESLEEVVVVGYGTMRREAKTGSITTVSSDEIKSIPATSFDKMLGGRMAGVSITSSSGQPGSNTNIRIRGTSSITAGNEPLYVVDGIPVMNGDQSYFTNSANAMAAINPNDIESITVLKDAAAASVYGSRAANGVILVTTKSGKSGQSTFTARAKYGVSWLANDNDFGVMNGKELLSYQRAAIVNAGKNPDDPTGTYYRPYELLNRPQTNWMDHFSRLGQMQEYEITAQGGGAKTKFYSSLSYHKNEGVFYGVDFQKMQARVNVDQELAKRLSMGARINVAYTKGTDVPMQSLYYSNPAWAGVTIQPWTPAYNADGSHNVNIPENSDSNPRATALYDDQWEKQYRFNGNIYLEWKPIKGLTIKTTDAAEMTFGEGRRYWAAETNKGEATLQSSTLQYRMLTTSNTITYDNKFGEHSFRILAGQEAMHRNYWSTFGFSPNVDPNIPFPGTSTPEQDSYEYSTNTKTLMSFFGILDYNYASRYFLQASMRYDGSSLFGQDNQWGLFYSVGASWNAHNESFLKDTEWVNLLKVRASYGLNGNNDIAVYKQYGVYVGSVYNGVTGMRPSTPANRKLSWEKSESWNVGVDFGFMDRFTGSFDVYSRKTTDMLLKKPLSQTSGFTTALQNVGSLKNTGIEFQLDASIFKDGDWTWNLGFNISHNKSEVLELAGDEMMTYTAENGDTDSRLKHIVGEKLLNFWLKDYYGVNPVNGEALYRDANGSITNDYNAAVYMNCGSPEPTYTGGINTTVSWKGLSLSALFEFKGGNKVMIIENRYLQSDGNQMSMNQAKSALNYWKKPGDTGCNPKPIAGNASNSYNFSTDRMIEKGDYMRIKDLTLSYTFPSALMTRAKLKNLRVYASAMNLYTFHDVNYWDPERGVDGMGMGIYPMTKTFVGGLEITF